MIRSTTFDSAFFEEMFDNSTAISAITDAEGFILRVNRRAMELFFGPDTPVDRVIGKNIVEFIHRDDRPKVFEQWEKSVSLRTEVSYELRMCAPDGRVMYFLISGRPIVKEGRVALFHYQALNMLEHKVQEQNLMATASADVIAQIAGGFAHDFNNLLTVINGYAQMMKLSLDETSPLLSKVVQIMEAGRKASELTQRMLEFSRRGVARTKIMDVSSELTNQEAIIRHIAGERVRVSFATESQLGKIAMDPSRFATILSNLVSNARDAMPEGGELTVRAEPFQTDTLSTIGDHQVGAGRYIRIAVEDTGGGMDAELLGRAGEPFFSTKDQGKGIGLWTVRNIVQNAGGFFHIDSAPGRGTTAVVLIPVADALPPARAAAGETTGDVHRRAPEGVTTVLIVEDDDTVRDLVNEVLGRQGFHTLTARNGGDALQIARQYSAPIDLLITDMVMRRIDGKMLARKMKSLWPDIRILFMSGYGRDIMEDDEFRGGAFLQKPFLPQDLVEQVERALQT